MIDEKKLVEYLIPILNKNNDMYLTGKVIGCIDNQPKIENTLGFKHFKMYSDSTLKSMNKDDLIDYIHTIYNNYKACDYFYNNTIDESYRLYQQLVELSRVCKSKDERIEELTSNQPLKFEELKQNMWVWDRHHNDYFHVCTKKINDDGVKILGNEYSYRKFEDNRFYLKEVKE